MRTFAIAAVMLVTVVSGISGRSSHASAATPLQRIALQFDGAACDAQHASISSALSTVPGVRAIDLSSVPNHALIDIDSRALSEHDLLSIVTQAMASSACRVEPMASCISAMNVEPVRSRHPTEIPSHVP
ncbi:MAG: hypothetical protein GDA67_11110 [Nitrospira sp. CR1.3]|nr:hypothetical protein [Nitrospira sp. CR1.3]